MKQALRGEDLDRRRPAGYPFYFKAILFVLYRENILSVEIRNASFFVVHVNPVFSLLHTFYDFNFYLFNNKMMGSRVFYTEDFSSHCTEEGIK